MSTRCNIHFTWGSQDTEANIYRHYDGYPDGVLPDLQKFFADVEAQTGDTRFNDASYLAAKFVVWQASQFAQDASKPLAFLGLGVVPGDAGDGEYVYTVNCGKPGPDGRPEVTYRKA